MSDEKKNKTKKVKLRAFSIKNLNLTDASSNIYNILLDKLQKSESTEERCMLLNPEDTSREKDLISYYENLSVSKSIFATMLRIAPGEDAQHITDELLKKKIFSMTELEELDANRADSIPAICIEHFYFSLNNEYLVTNLAGNKTITNLQTYIGWLIKNELLEFTPVITLPSDTKLSDLKGLIVKDPINDPPEKSSEDTSSTTSLSTGDKPNESTSSRQKSLRLDKHVVSIIMDLLKEDITLEETDIRQLISAELLIKFKKPNKMPVEEYKRILGAYLKPVSDIDNIAFKRSDGKTEVKGKDLLKTKTVDIDVTKTGKISEPALLQEMSKFLTELKTNEKKDN